jgi:hypothetical protein
MDRGHGYSSGRFQQRTNAQGYAYWQNDATGEVEWSNPYALGESSELSYGDASYGGASEPYSEGDWTLYHDEGGAWFEETANTREGRGWGLFGTLGLLRNFARACCILWHSCHTGTHRHPKCMYDVWRGAPLGWVIYCR